MPDLALIADRSAGSRPDADGIAGALTAAAVHLPE
jgi:hypothetical protein